MRISHVFLLLSIGLTVSACVQYDRKLAPLQRYYAERGDQMIATSNKVEQQNPQQDTTPHLSTKTPPPTN